MRVRDGRVSVAAADLLLALDHDLDPDRRPPCQARSAPTWATTFDLESAVPRPKIAPSRSSATNGGELHSDSSPAGTTS